MATKKSVMEQIEEKVRRKKALSAQIEARRTNIEAFVLQMLQDIDEMVNQTSETALGPSMMPYYIDAMQERVRTVDGGANVQVTWQDVPEGETPRVTGILIKWSEEYQTAHSCDPELFVDIASLMFQ